MTRKVYIGDTKNNAEACMDLIKRHSEDRIHFYVLTPEDLIDSQLAESAHKEKLLFFVPFLNQYQGMALYVNSNFAHKLDVDMFFNYKVMNQLGSILYFVQHDAWLFDCNDPALKVLTPSSINNTEIDNLKRELTITVIDTI